MQAILINWETKKIVGVPIEQIDEISEFKAKGFVHVASGLINNIRHAYQYDPYATNDNKPPDTITT